MKKILTLLMFSTLLFSCADNSTTTTKYLDEPKQRIIGKEYTVYEGYGYQIIDNQYFMGDKDEIKVEGFFK